MGRLYLIILDHWRLHALDAVRYQHRSTGSWVRFFFGEVFFRLSPFLGEGFYFYVRLLSWCVNLILVGQLRRGNDCVFLLLCRMALLFGKGARVGFLLTIVNEEIFTATTTTTTTISIKNFVY